MSICEIIILAAIFLLLVVIGCTYKKKMIEVIEKNYVNLTYLSIISIVLIALILFIILPSIDGLNWDWGNSIAFFVGMISIAIAIGTGLQNNLQFKKENKNSENRLDKQLNYRFRKTALITLNSIIIQLIILESNIEDDYKKNNRTKKYDYEFSKWVFKKLLDDKKNSQYHTKLIETYKSQFQKLNDNSSNEDNSDKKNGLDEICLRTAKFYQNSMYYELPKSVQDELNSLKQNPDMDKLEKLNKKINDCLKNDNCLNKFSK